MDVNKEKAQKPPSFAGWWEEDGTKEDWGESILQKKEKHKKNLSLQRKYSVS